MSSLTWVELLLSACQRQGIGPQILEQNRPFVAQPVKHRLGPIGPPANRTLPSSPPPDLPEPEEFSTLASLVLASDPDREQNYSVEAALICGGTIYTAVPVFSDPGTNIYGRSDDLRELTLACTGQPALFVKYFRLYGVFPICFSPEKGHIREVYNGITKEAERTGLAKLVVWLKAELWKKAISYSVDVENPAFVGQPEGIDIPVLRPGGVVFGTSTVHAPFWCRTAKRAELNQGWCTEDG